MQGIRILFGALLLLLVAGGLSQVASAGKAAPPNTVFAYDTTNQVTIEGKIQEVRDYNCPVTGTVGSHITVKNAEGTIEVHLAPAKFLKEYEIVLKAGDEVKVVGSKITYEGKPAILARTVTVGRETFAFRDDKGKPIW